MTFAIKSAQSDATLKFVDFDGDSFTVELRGSEVSAVRRIWGYTDCQPLVNVLHCLARQERGWQDSAEWRSIESDLILQFRSDSRGHVFIDIQMRRSYGEEQWRLTATIQTELGQIPKIAADAASFFLQE